MVNLDALAEHLLDAGAEPFGLLTHQATSTADFLRDRFGTQLAAIFSPEHGFFGSAAAGEHTKSSTHPVWDIPLFSLYGETRKPTPEMLNGLGRIVIDLQDLGYRCYTYLATTKLMLEACAEANIPVTVVDRPIPLGGIIDGPLLDGPNFASFVAPVNVPLCHGMTPGEIAMWIIENENIDVDLSVIRMKDWTHRFCAPWRGFMPPSPAVRSWDSAVMYPALVFTEAFPAIDCDRNGNLPFRVFGTPKMNAVAIAKELEKPLSVCGIGVRPYHYAAKDGRYAGETINGVLLSCEQPNAFYPVTAGTLILAELYDSCPEIMEDARPDWLTKLAGTKAINDVLKSGDFTALFASWIERQDSFLETRVNLY